MQAALSPARTPPSSQEGRATPTDATTTSAPRITPPPGILSPPDSAVKNPPAAAVKPARQPQLQRTKDPLRLLDLTPPELRNLLISSFPPERNIRIPNVSPDDLDAWESQHGFTRGQIPEPRTADPRHHGFTYSYDSTTKSFIVRCMPSPYHAGVQRFFGIATETSLQDTLGRALYYATDTAGLLIGGSEDVKGFTGIDGLAPTSHKIPDFAIKARGTEFPAVAVECGFSEDLVYLLCDAELLLTGTGAGETGGQTKLVVLVELRETFRLAGDNSSPIDDSSTTASDDEDNDEDENPPRRRRAGKHDWPIGVDLPMLLPGQDKHTSQQLQLKSRELAAWLHVADHDHRLGRYPLIGKVTAVAYVYCRTEEAAYLRSELGISAKEDEEEDDDDEEAGEAHKTGEDMAKSWPKITRIYRYTCMTEDQPTPVPTTSTRPPSSLHIPLHLLYPPGASHLPASINPQHLASPVIFDFANLATEVLKRRASMLQYRALDRAGLMLRKWQEQWAANEKNKPELSVRGTKRAGADGQEEEEEEAQPEKGQQGKKQGGAQAQAAQGMQGKGIKAWKRQRRLEYEAQQGSGGSDDVDQEDGDDDDGDDVDAEWTPDCD